MAFVLRHYQQQAISDLRAAYRAGFNAPLLVLPTGAGKTVVFSAIAASAAERGRRVLILVHRRELIRQASAKLAAVGADCQVMSVQSLIRRLDRQPPPDLIIVDEAHHVTAGNTWGKILNHYPNAFRLGVTATPCRLDGRGLGNAFDTIVHGPSVAQLIDARFLTSARIYAPPVIADLAKLRSRGGDYAANEAAERMNRPSITGDAIGHYQRLAEAQQAIAFCCNVKHAEAVAAQFQAANIKAATLLGSTPTAERDARVAAFGAGQLQVLVTVDVISEGFDVPAAGCAILLRPTQSLGLYLQQVGRVLRPAPNKAAAIVLDHVGNVTRHGFPDEHREWSLADGVRRTSRKIREIAGELQELQRVERRQQQRQARTLAQLLAIAKQRGYSPGWAYKVHNARSNASR